MTNINKPMHVTIKSENFDGIANVAYIYSDSNEQIVHVEFLNVDHNDLDAIVAIDIPTEHVTLSEINLKLT